MRSQFKTKILLAAFVFFTAAQIQASCVTSLLVSEINKTTIISDRFFLWKLFKPDPTALSVRIKESADVEARVLDLKAPQKVIDDVNLEIAPRVLSNDFFVLSSYGQYSGRTRYYFFDRLGGYHGSSDFGTHISSVAPGMIRTLDLDYSKSSVRLVERSFGKAAEIHQTIEIKHEEKTVGSWKYFQFMDSTTVGLIAEMVYRQESSYVQPFKTTYLFTQINLENGLANEQAFFEVPFGSKMNRVEQEESELAIYFDVPAKDYQALGLCLGLMCGGIGGAIVGTAVAGTANQEATSLVFRIPRLSPE